MFELLNTASETGHRVVIFGLGDAPRRAFQAQSARYQHMLQVASLA